MIRPDYESVRTDDENTQLAEMLALQDEIQAIQEWPKFQSSGLQGMDRITQERWVIWDRIQAMIDAWELPKNSHRLQKRRNLQIEIISLWRSISRRNIKQRRNPSWRRKGIWWIDTREVNHQAGDLIQLKNRKNIPDRVHFWFKGGRITITFGEKIEVQVNSIIQTTFEKIPLNIAKKIKQYNSL